MYFPYLRGKQFDLIAIRELSDNLPKELFCPIIEPVRTNLAPLLKTIKHLNDNNISPVIIVTPQVGDCVGETDYLLDGLAGDDLEYLPCVVIKGGNYQLATETIRKINKPYAVQITDGISAECIDIANNSELNIVDSDFPPGALTRIRNVVLFGDFFQKQKRNADYKLESGFSHLHTTFSNLANAVGFSDYTIVSSEYSESGGPAFVVTIHMSYINKTMFDEMFIRHYSSTDDGTPADPAAKFAEALQKMVADANAINSIFFQSRALDEFRKLHERGHFPGLGHVKKLSIEHHIETVCDYLKSDN